MARSASTNASCVFDERRARRPVRFARLLAAGLFAGAFWVQVPQAPAQEAAGPAAPDCAARDLLETLSPAIRAEIEAQAQAVPNGQGRLFRIERDGLPPSHLFGTMHLADPRILALPSDVRSAFGTADRLVVETLDIADEARLAGALLARPELTVLPPGTRLLDLVPGDRREAVSARLAERDMPVESVATLQPWFVAVALALPPCEAQRQAAGEEVLDLALLRQAQARGMALDGLETAGEQMQALAGMPLDLQARQLVATLDRLDEIPDVFETMVGLYLDGRIAKITPTIERLAPMGGEGEEAASVLAAFEARVVDDRNAVMAERLDPLLAHGGAFVAVGALHLPGERGLVARLAEEGWRVTRAD